MPDRDRFLRVVPDAAEQAARKPRLGLALGGGASRGFAHIGVIRELLAAGFEVEAIAGTSIGAVVGGCHAAGRLDELEAWARALTRRQIFNLLDLSLQGGGLIGGTKLGQLLLRDLGRMAIEDLSIPFAAVATEYGSGHEVWLSKGPLVRAMRASYALPGIFEPVQAGGRWLMDGALVNPVPVSTARALGARVVVAVNLCGEAAGRGSLLPGHGAYPHEHDDLERPRPGARAALGAATGLVKRRLGLAGRAPAARAGRAPGISAIILDAFNVTQDRISRARLAGDPPDVMVLPRVGQVGLFEFHRAAEIIDLGAEATRRSLQTIRETIAALG